MRMFLRSWPALLLVCIPLSVQALPWDVPADHPHKESIEYAVAAKLIRGYEDRSFRPESAVLRQEFVVILARALLPERIIETCLTEIVPPERLPEIALSDADYDSWYGRELCALQMAGVIEGYPDGSFRPLGGVNLAEAGKFLAQAYDLSAIDLPTLQPEGWEWYVPYVRMLSDRKTLPITLRGFAYPVTRGELAVMLHRLREPEMALRLRLTEYLLYEDFTDTGTWTRTAVSRYGFAVTHRAEWPAMHWLLRGRRDARFPREASAVTAFMGPIVPCPGGTTCIERAFAIDVFDRSTLEHTLEELADTPSLVLLENVTDDRKTRWLLYREPDCRTPTLLVIPRTDYYHRLTGPCENATTAQAYELHRMARTMEAIPVRNSDANLRSRDF